jgi:broad specificity phosphatase PhoE
MSIFVLARHAETTLNLAGRVNGDPMVQVDLTEKGIEESRRLGLQLAQLPIDLCVHTRFPRTRETAAHALSERQVPFHEEPLLDDIDVGRLEGETIDAYREWKKAHSRRDLLPGGESLELAAHRYARAFARLAERDYGVVLVVCHEVPLRYALNGASGSDSLEGPVHELPNATPFLFGGDALGRAAQAIQRLAHV